MPGFAIYRLPYESQVTLVLQTEGEPVELSSCTELNGRQGFVMAPFEVRPDQPILLIRPDKVETVPVQEIHGFPDGTQGYCRWTAHPLCHRLCQ